MVIGGMMCVGQTLLPLLIGGAIALAGLAVCAVSFSIVVEERDGPGN